MTDSSRQYRESAFDASTSKSENPSVVIVALTAVIAVWAAYCSWSLHDRLVLDESHVLGQVRVFLDHKIDLYRYPGDPYPAGSMLPGFAALLTIIAGVTRQSSVSALRLFCFVLSIPYAIVLYFLARRIARPGNAVLRAAQTFLLPIVFPFNCLLYTDVVSLLMNAVALLAALRRSYLLAGFLMLISMLMRQTNVVFIGFICGFCYIETFDFQFSLDRLIAFARQIWPLLLGIAAFGAFVLIHGRIALDDPWHHTATLSPGNIAFSLVLFAIVFLPIILVHLIDILRWTKTHPLNTGAIILACACVAGVYYPRHPWNHIGLILHNELLADLLRSVDRRLLFGVILIVTTLWIAARGFRRPSGWILIPFWLASLVPIAMVEPRYTFPPMVLFQLLRKPESPAMEKLLWIWFALGGIVLVHVLTTTYYSL